MIPLHKLEKLPCSQRLRKAANFVGGAQKRLIVSGRITAAETEYIGRVLEMLMKDQSFSETAAAALNTAKSGIAAAYNENEILRILNTVHHLLLAETGRYQADWDFIDLGGTLDPSKRRPFPGMQVYLEDIRSPFNVGSMFRAADSFGAEKVWLSSLCADPRHKRAERTAMGCVDVLPWERFTHDPFAVTSTGAFIKSQESTLETGLKEGSLSGFSEGPFFTMETGGTPLADFPFPPRGIMIAGCEELGVSPGALAAADASLGRVTIPSYGTKASLNVSVAFGIVMQAWAAQLAKL